MAQWGVLVPADTDTWNSGISPPTPAGAESVARYGVSRKFATLLPDSFSQVCACVSYNSREWNAISRAFCRSKLGPYSSSRRDVRYARLILHTSLGPPNQSEQNSTLPRVTFSFSLSSYFIGCVIFSHCISLSYQPWLYLRDETEAIRTPGELRLQTSTPSRFVCSSRLICNSNSIYTWPMALR